MLFQPRSGIRMQLRAQACEVYAFAERLGGADSPPWQRRGGRAIKKYPRSIERRGRGGSFKLQNSFFERTTPSAPIRWLRDNFLTGAATPPCQGGDFASTPTFGNSSRRSQTTATVHPVFKQPLHLISQRRNTEIVKDLGGKRSNQNPTGLVLANTAALEIKDRVLIDLPNRRTVNTANIVRTNLELWLRVDLGPLRQQEILAVLYRIGLLRILANRNCAIEHAGGIPGEQAFIQLATRSMGLSMIDMRVVIDEPAAAGGKQSVQRAV